MGFSLSDLNPVSLISNAAESVCDAILPKNLEFVGDLVGIAADIETGNWAKGLDDLQDLLKDLPQQIAELSGQQLHNGFGDALLAPSFLEPSPPASPGAQPSTAPPAGSTQGAGSSPASVQSAPGAPADGFLGLSDAALMNAVRAGNIPDSVKNDPAQMRRLEVRMNDITEMNHLITSMLKAMHDMNTQVIQNIRV